MTHQKLLLSALLTISATGMMEQALATDLSYDHQYEDVTKAHLDEFGIAHHFDSGLKMSAGLEFTPQDKSNGESGNAFKNERWHETKLGLSYPIKLDDGWAVEPGFSWARKQDEYKYKPSLKIKKALTDSTKVGVGYRYQVTDYSKKATKKVNRMDFSISQKIAKATLKYEFSNYQGNKDLYNHSEHDYQHEVDLSYSLSNTLSPFISVKNESVSSKSDQRQSEIDVGFDLKI